MVLASLSDPKQEHSTLQLSQCTIFQSGTMMEAAHIRLSLIKVKSFLNQSPTTETHSDVVITSWLCARPGTGRTTLAKSSYQPTQTSDTLPKKSGTTLMLPKKKLGMVSSKNTLLLASQLSSPSSPSAGQTTDTQAHRVLTIAPSVPTSPSVAQSQTLTTKLASTLVSRFQAPMLKLCQANGNTKLAQFMVSQSEINSGFLVGYSAVSQRTTTLMFPSLPSCSQNGMVQAATPTFPLRQ